MTRVYLLGYVYHFTTSKFLIHQFKLGDSISTARKTMELLIYSLQYDCRKRSMSQSTVQCKPPFSAISL